jgi:uncharacterized membrane protein YedE/YeeE
MLRYVAVLLVIVLVMLALRRFARGERTEPVGPPASVWAWLLVPLVIAIVVAFGFGLREWALAD